MTNDAEKAWEGPLAGVRVLDFTRILAGPFATQILGDLGAEILKLEPPGVGDETRTYAPHHNGESHYFVSINRSKKSIVIDLKTPEGVEIVRELVRDVDVVVENFRPGVLDRLGLGYEELSAINPRLIYCAISGFGMTGPLRDKPSFDIVTQALTGAMSVNGRVGESPVKLGLPLGDMVGGVFGPIAILSALHERETTGRGRLIDISLYDGLMGMLGYLPQLYFFTGEEPVPRGSGHPHVVPYGAFDASDGSILIACLTQSFWMKFANAIGRPDIAEAADYATMADRVRNREVLEPLIGTIIATRTVAEWTAILEAADVPNAPVLSVGAALAHDHARARAMVETVDHRACGPLPVVGRPVKFPGMRQGPLEPPPMLGEHTHHVLREVLGYSDEHLATLARAGAIPASASDIPQE